MKPTVTIEYCPKCGWLLRAAYMAQELLTTFNEELKAVTLQPSEVSGDFHITIDGKKIFDRKEYGGFPEIKELKQLVRDIAAPGKSLGHSDTKPHPSTMIGVILCGGQSSRMGTDKGLLKLHANTWAQTAVDKLAELQLPVVISVNKNQYADYATIFSPQQLITDNDSLQIKGPLAGLLSVHLQHPAEDLLLLACDMPLMETSLLKELLTIYNQFCSRCICLYQ